MEEEDMEAEAEEEEEDMGVVEEEEEQEDVWSRLPDEVVERVWKRLTAYDCIRVGCTCKRFRSILLLHHSSSDPCRPNLLLLPLPSEESESEEESEESEDEPELRRCLSYACSCSCSYEPSLGKWIPLPLSFLTSHLSPSSFPVASAGGLLCLTSGSRGSCSGSRGSRGSGPGTTHSLTFVLCNPLTKSCRVLPPHIPSDVCQNLAIDVGEQNIPTDFNDEDSVHAFGLITFDHEHDNPHPPGYEFYAINYTSRNGTCLAMAYTSNLCRWQGLSVLTMEQPYCTLSSMNIVVMGRNTGIDRSNAISLYSLWKKRSEFVIYHLAQGTWTEIESPECESSLVSAHLIDCYGVLHMVAGVGIVWLPSNVIESPTSVRIWRLNMPSKSWSEVTRMPAAVLHEFRSNIDFESLQCLGKDGVIYLTSLLKEVLMYDMETGDWKWFEADFFDEDKGFVGFILEPSLTSP